METQEIDVIATKMDNVNFYYECPNCWSSYKKNGEPYKKATHIMHIHGSGNDFSNRIEPRWSHCVNVKDKYHARIHITDKTRKLK